MDMNKIGTVLLIFKSEIHSCMLHPILNSQSAQVYCESTLMCSKSINEAFCLIYKAVTIFFSESESHIDISVSSSDEFDLTTF